MNTLECVLDGRFPAPPPWGLEAPRILERLLQHAPPLGAGGSLPFRALALRPRWRVSLSQLKVLVPLVGQGHILTQLGMERMLPSEGGRCPQTVVIVFFL